MSEKLLKLEQIKVKDGFNPRYDYGDIEEMARYFAQNGVRLMSPLIVEASRDANGVIIPDSYDIIDGHRRYAAMLGMHIKPAAVRCSIAEKLKEGDSVTLAFTANQGKHLSPWEQAEVVDRLVKLNYSQSKVSKTLGISEVRVSRLSLLTDLPDWIWEAGLKGQLSATLVWQLYDDSIEINNSKLPNTIKALEKQRKKIFEVGVTARDFDFSSPLAKLTAELKEAKERAENERKAKEVKEAELRAATEAARIAKEQQTKAQADKAELEKTHKEQDKGAEGLQAAQAAANAAAPAAPTTDAAAPTNTNAAAAPVAPVTSDAPASVTSESTNNNAVAKGQGETGQAHRKARAQALVGMIAAAADTTSLTKDCKNRLGDAVHRLNDIQRYALELMGLTE